MSTRVRAIFLVCRALRGRSECVDPLFRQCRKGLTAWQPQRRVLRSQADRETRPQSQHDEMEGAAQRRLSEARCTQPARTLRLDMP
jgi:hypothetical protein